MRNSEDNTGAFILRMVFVIALASALIVQVIYALSRNITLAVVVAIAAIAAMPVTNFVRALITPGTRAQALGNLHADAQGAARMLSTVWSAIRWLCSRAQAWLRWRIQASTRSLVRGLAALIVRQCSPLAVEVVSRVVIEGLTADEREALLLAVADEVGRSHLTDHVGRSGPAQPNRTEKTS